MLLAVNAKVKLPGKVVARILDRMDQQTLLACTLVSKGWCATVLDLRGETLVQNPRFRKDLTADQFCAYIRTCMYVFADRKKKVKCINLQGCKFKDTLKILSLLALSGLVAEELQLELRLTPFFGRSLEQDSVAKLLGRLQRLDIRLPALSGTILLDKLLGSVVKKLKSLKLTLCKEADGNIEFPTDHLFKRLTNLELYGEGKTNTRALRRTVTRFHKHNTFPKLRQLTLKCYPVSLDILQTLLTPSLRVLSAFLLPGIHLRDVIRLLDHSETRLLALEFQKVRTLQSTLKLRTSDPRPVTYESLRSLVVFRVSGSSMPEKEFLRMLRAASSLRVLAFSSSRFFRYDVLGLVDMLGSCPLLLSISLQTCLDDTFCKIFGRALVCTGLWKRLEELDLRGNEDITLSGIDSLFNRQFPLQLRTLLCDCQHDQRFVDYLGRKSTCGQRPAATAAAAR